MTSKRADAQVRAPLRRTAVAAVPAAFFAPAAAQGEWAVNLPTPVTEVARVQYDLHMLIFWICVVIFVIVFSVMFYSIYAHRKSRGHQSASFSHSTRAEIVWTVIPVLILISMAIPSTHALLMMEDTTESEMTLKVTGYQWRWHYDYMDHDVEFFSTLATPRDQIEGGAEKGEHYLLEVDRPVVLPTGKKIRILFTANDVIHAWWVPKIGGKKDAIPGFINEVWTRIDEPGVYRGQCAELCGKDHGFMPIVVEAVSEEEFNAWIAEQGGTVPGSQAPAVAPESGAGDSTAMAGL